jgi:L-cysteate sulfo-lyase
MKIDQILTQFPRLPLAHLPTPLEPLTQLSKELGGPHLFIKRDDCTGLALGGNKTRKLEFLLGEALANGITTIVTEGGVQSNHVRQSAAAAVRAGLECVLVLDDKVGWPDPAYHSGGNRFLDTLLGAEVRFCEAGESRQARIDSTLEELKQHGTWLRPVPKNDTVQV